MINTIELFCGTKSFSKVAKELGYNTFTMDIDPKNNPDLICDILEFDISMIPFDKVDYLWMSPPCTTFSVASLRHYWINGKPKNDKCLMGISYVKKAIEIKDKLLKLNPNMKWYIENPRGMLRKQEFMSSMCRKTITYCKYGSKVMKPTDIWTNDFSWTPRKMCHPGDSCHERAMRSSRNGTQAIVRNSVYDINDALARGVIPSELFKDIFNIKKEEQLKLVQS